MFYNKFDQILSDEKTKINFLMVKEGLNGGYLFEGTEEFPGHYKLKFSTLNPSTPLTKALSPEEMVKIVQYFEKKAAESKCTFFEIQKAISSRTVKDGQSLLINEGYVYHDEVTKDAFILIKKTPVNISLKSMIKDLTGELSTAKEKIKLMRRACTSELGAFINHYSANMESSKLKITFDLKSNGKEHIYLENKDGEYYVDLGTEIIPMSEFENEKELFDSLKEKLGVKLRIKFLLNPPKENYEDLMYHSGLPKATIDVIHTKLLEKNSAIDIENYSFANRSNKIKCTSFSNYYVYEIMDMSFLTDINRVFIKHFQTNEKEELRAFCSEQIQKSLEEKYKLELQTELQKIKVSI